MATNNNFAGFNRGRGDEPFRDWAKEKLAV